MMPKMASGAKAMIHWVKRNIAARTPSMTLVTGRASSPMLASAMPKRTEKTSVGRIFCAAITATMFEGMRSMKYLTQSTPIARFGGILPVGTRLAPTPG